jgi:hypothetical protein
MRLQNRRFVSYEDFAIALLDEVETPRHIGAVSSSATNLHPLIRSTPVILLRAFLSASVLATVLGGTAPRLQPRNRRWWHLQPQCITTL